MNPIAFAVLSGICSNSASSLHQLVGTSTVSGANPTLTIPAETSSTDLIVVQCSSNAVGSYDNVSGFTKVAEASVNNINRCFFYRLPAASPPSSITLRIGLAQMRASACVFRKVQGGSYSFIAASYLAGTQSPGVNSQVGALEIYVASTSSGCSVSDGSIFFELDAVNAFPQSAARRDGTGATAPASQWTRSGGLSQIAPGTITFG